MLQIDDKLKAQIAEMAKKQALAQLKTDQLRANLTEEQRSLVDQGNPAEPYFFHESPMFSGSVKGLGHIDTGYGMMPWSKIKPEFQQKIKRLAADQGVAWPGTEPAAEMASVNTPTVRPAIQKPAMSGRPPMFSQTSPQLSSQMPSQMTPVTRPAVRAENPFLLDSAAPLPMTQKSANQPKSATRPRPSLAMRYKYK